MEFRILGPLEILDGDRVRILRGAKERALLTFLLLHAGQLVLADRLIDELWGEDPPESARKSLQVRVTGVRKELGSDRVVTVPSGYVLRVAADGFDLDRFQRLMSASDSAEPAEAAELLREALALWRGPALADFRYDSWAQPAIARLEELRVVALEKRIDADLALGRHLDVVGEIEALVGEFPLRERLRGQLMLALYRGGRQVEALEVYNETRRALVGEFGIEPTQALGELERAILRHDDALDPPQLAQPQRSILVVAFDERNLDALLALGGPLARTPRRELIMARPLAAAADLVDATAKLQLRRERLLSEGIASRAAAFTSAAPGPDTVHVAVEQDVDLLLVDAPQRLLADSGLATVLAAAPCDVAVLTTGALGTGPVLVPFTGAEHDWSAVEIGAWLARAQQVPLRLAGPGGEPRDASRLLADASLAVQRALGVAPEPLLVDPGPDDLVDAAADAGVVVAGLSDRWRKDGLGPVRSALISAAGPPVLLVRRGLRPGGLAPPLSYTRFTWTMAPV
jgi:DNA-binding SARP family transcriptional activator